ncbi:MAG: hypothetical protein IH946_05780 [Bacteroidetes bacterium]|nr:hypothetical protein [Bacteroidota bacterium]
MRNTTILTLAFLITTSLITGCSKTKPDIPEGPQVSRDHVYKTNLRKIRLGDGVPLDLKISVRWKVDDIEGFYYQFAKPSDFDSLILIARERELVSNISHNYASVDSVFTTQRRTYIQELKNSLLANLGEETVIIKEVIISEVIFPLNYTNAKEVIGLKDQELEVIRQQIIIDQEISKARKTMVESDGLVKIAQAKIEGELQALNAVIEKSRRKMELEKAQTIQQVSEMNARTEAKRMELLAKADLIKKKDLKDLEMQKVKELQQLAINKQKELEKIELDKIAQLDQLDMKNQESLAALCSNYPTYAAFLVNKELASKVEIAVLPAGNGNLFGDFLNQKMTAKK